MIVDRNAEKLATTNSSLLSTYVALFFSRACVTRLHSCTAFLHFCKGIKALKAHFFATYHFLAQFFSLHNLLSLNAL